MTSSRLPTAGELTAARQASFQSITDIIDGRGERDEDDDDTDDEDTAGDANADSDFKNGDMARLEALLIQSMPQTCAASRLSN